MRRALRSSAATLTAISALLLTGCGGDSGTADVFGAGGWPGMHADARNSNTSAVTGSRSLDFEWSRPLGGLTPTNASVAANGQIFLTAQADEGCNLFSFQIDSGRKRWCTRIGAGAATSTPVVDAATNVYIGDEGAMTSFDQRGQLRWRTPVSGTPRSAQFTGDGNLLFVTHLGQVNVLDPQTGFTVAPSYDLIPPASYTQGANIEPVPNDQGLDGCLAGGPQCPVAGTPAIDPGTGRVVFTFWRPFAAQADLVAMRYTGGENPRLVEDWSTSTLPGGPAGGPALSADGKTVYANDNAGHLWAVDAETGEPRWSHDLGYPALGTPSTSADGLILPAGGENGRLLALRDRGDRAEPVWERNDLLHLGVPAQTAGATGYTVVRDGDTGLALLTFDTGTGDTLDQDTLPGATGYTVGTSIGPDGEVLTPTLIGELFVLK
ncbi:PQQ-binding-like beta-propeller repeat protein [Prescottella defluvii]|uniref:outer membrane protein assembly factor BamB family protein n=1 Tax=Prescottella defluvii TaxID=1323361 RepID=UPI0004F2E765|nr:PQQ-binding-like beta-propeller repeat protein [Prescottella defluvii]